MINEVLTVPAIGSSHQGWLVYWAWANYITMGVILGVVVGATLVASGGITFRPKRLCNKRLEWWWSMIPIIIIIFLDIPNLVINYASEKNPYPIFGAKILGHQWYWEYELEYLLDDGLILDSVFYYINRVMNSSSLALVNFLTSSSWGAMAKLSWDWCSGFSTDSYKVAINNLGSRFGLTDTRLVLPTKSPCRLVCSSLDVIHNFNIKSLGVSVDCVPGRLNQHKLHGSGVGVFNGLCSELCGVNHPHMPCVVEMLPLGIFFEWLSSMYKVGGGFYNLSGGQVGPPIELFKGSVEEEIGGPQVKKVGEKIGGPQVKKVGEKIEAPVSPWKCEKLKGKTTKIVMVSPDYDGDFSEFMEDKPPVFTVFTAEEYNKTVERISRCEYMVLSPNKLPVGSKPVVSVSMGGKLVFELPEPTPRTKTDSEMYGDFVLSEVLMQKGKQHTKNPYVYLLNYYQEVNKLLESVFNPHKAIGISKVKGWHKMMINERELMELNFVLPKGCQPVVLNTLKGVSSEYLNGVFKPEPTFLEGLNMRMNGVLIIKDYLYFRQSQVGSYFCLVSGELNYGFHLNWWVSVTPNSVGIDFQSWQFVDYEE